MEKEEHLFKKPDMLRKLEEDLLGITQEEWAIAEEALKHKLEKKENKAKQSESKESLKENPPVPFKVDAVKFLRAEINRLHARRSAEMNRLRAAMREGGNKKKEQAAITNRINAITKKIREMETKLKKVNHSFIYFDGKLFATKIKSYLGRGSFGKVRLFQSEPPKDGGSPEMLAVKIISHEKDQKGLLTAHGKKQKDTSAVEIEILRERQMLKGTFRRHEQKTNSLQENSPSSLMPTKKVKNEKLYLLQEVYEYPLDNLVAPYVVKDKVGNVTIKNRKKLLELALDAVRRIQSLHQLGYLHRDIKSDNFMGNQKGDQILLYDIDYGLSARDRKKGHSTQQKQRKGRRLVAEKSRLVGSPTYMEPAILEIALLRELFLPDTFKPGSKEFKGCSESVRRCVSNMPSDQLLRNVRFNKKYDEFKLKYNEFKIKYDEFKIKHDEFRRGKRDKDVSIPTPPIPSIPITTEKSDIFSLGILLLSALHLNDISTVKRMVSYERNHRPSLAEVICALLCELKGQMALYNDVYALLMNAQGITSSTWKKIEEIEDAELREAFKEFAIAKAEEMLPSLIVKNKNSFVQHPIYREIVDVCQGVAKNNFTDPEEKLKALKVKIERIEDSHVKQNSKKFLKRWVLGDQKEKKRTESLEEKTKSSLEEEKMIRRFLPKFNQEYSFSGTLSTLKSSGIADDLKVSVSDQFSFEKNIKDVVSDQFLFDKERDRWQCIQSQDFDAMMEQIDVILEETKEAFIKWEEESKDQWVSQMGVNLVKRWEGESEQKWKEELERKWEERWEEKWEKYWEEELKPKWEKDWEEKLKPKWEEEVEEFVMIPGKGETEQEKQKMKLSKMEKFKNEEREKFKNEYMQNAEINYKKKEINNKEIEKLKNKYMQDGAIGYKEDAMRKVREMMDAFNFPTALGAKKSLEKHIEKKVENIVKIISPSEDEGNPSREIKSKRARSKRT